LLEIALEQAEKQREKAASLPWAHLRLPPFPQVAIRVMQLANNENVQLHQLGELISSDPAFATEVLTVANSLLYAPRYPANSILQAIAVLGANTLQGMCITVGVRAYLGKTMNQTAMRNVWRHNLACAMIAERIASAGLLDKDAAYTSGILHDVGRMALAVIQPAQYATLLERKTGEPVGILEDECETFGWDHCQAGLELISGWRLPPEFASVVSEHHFPRQREGAWCTAELIKISCRMADALGYPAFPGCSAAPFAGLLEELPARELRNFRYDRETLSSDVKNGIHIIESL
jgi:putative nucleotidyltransferase with HDIG domain